MLASDDEKIIDHAPAPFGLRHASRSLISSIGKSVLIFASAISVRR